MLGSGPHAKVTTMRGQYSETVFLVDHTLGPSVQLVGVEQVGDSPDAFMCTSDADRKFDPLSKSQFWYIIDSYRIFSKCDRAEAIELAKKLVASPSGNIQEVPDYLLPFKVGELWGADPAYPKRDDDFYQWSIEDGETDVTVPAGKFKGCYALFYRTMPDHEIRWICPSVGLVATEYEHHGTTHHIRIELQSYRRGATHKAK
jgi:hypothetical protein